MTPGRALALALAVFAGLWAWSHYRAGPAEEEVERDPPAIPAPASQARVVYFYKMLGSGEIVELDGRQHRVWQVLGERGLRAASAAAFSYVLAPERFPEYRRSPGMLSNVLHFLHEAVEVRDHALLVPFVLHWLDPANAPTKTEGGDWATIWRPELFRLMARYPQRGYVPTCVAEFREHGTPDMRGYALDILLYLGATDELSAIASGLVADPEEEEVEMLRRRLLVNLVAFARSGQAPERRAVPEALRPFLLAVAKSNVPVARIHAAATRMRLGDEDAADALVAEYETLEAAGDEVYAWDALRLLCADGRHPYVRTVALRRAKEPSKTLGYVWAIKLLSRWWLDEPDVRAVVWDVVRNQREFVPPLVAIPNLTRTGRAEVVDYLDAEIRSGDTDRIHVAVRFATNHPVPELGPAIFDALEIASAPNRPYFFRALSALRMKRVAPLLVAELNENRPDSVRNMAATELLVLRARLDDVETRLRAGDVQVFDALVRAAVAGGADGVPEQLVPAVLSALRTLPGEVSRLRALFILRCRGTLSGVREGLIEAYRREPSRRVARAIESTLVELAHR